MGKSKATVENPLYQPSKSHKLRHEPRKQEQHHQIPEPQKLTKQQKRDLKRNKKTQHERHYNDAMQLKHDQSSGISAYKRQTIYPPLPQNVSLDPLDRFIDPSDGTLYKKILCSSYEGFVVIPGEDFDETYHRDFGDN